MRDQRFYMLHAVDAIDAILDYTADGREAFFSDRKTQDAVSATSRSSARAVKGLSEETRALEPEVPWRQIAGRRDKLIHEYFGVDLGLVWDVVERELPLLRSTIDGLSQRFAEEAAGPHEGAQGLAANRSNEDLADPLELRRVLPLWTFE